MVILTLTLPRILFMKSFFDWINENTYDSQATVLYGPGIRMIAEVDQELSEYYRSLIPKYYNVKPQRYKCHITIVRTGIETPTNMEFWGKYQDQKISFSYSPIIQNDGTYFWLDAYSSDIEKIREELGLPKYRKDRKEYHITIANIK